MKTFTLNDVRNKIVLVRIDLNLPKNDNRRLIESVPTLKMLKVAKQIIILSHKGRPDGFDKKLSLKQEAKKLEKILKEKIPVVNYEGPIPKNKYVVIENLRFNKEERKGDRFFAKRLAMLGEVYINEAFSVSHRNDSSMQIQKFLPSFVGMHLEKEVKEIEKIIKNMKIPFTLILGGAKIDKLIQLKKLVKKADNVLIGGAMMFTFLKLDGKKIGKSLCFEDKRAKKLRKIVTLPVDVVLDNGKTVSTEKITSKSKGMDIGKKTIIEYEKIIKKSKTIIWNGPMGVIELKKFQNGTKKIASAISKAKAKTLVGGGDTLSIINNKFTYSSSAGGAFLSFIAGEKMPGLKKIR